MNAKVVGLALVNIVLIALLIGGFVVAQGPDQTPTPQPMSWFDVLVQGVRVTGGADVQRRPDGTMRIDFDLWLRLNDWEPTEPSVTPTPTTVPESSPTPTIRPTETATPTATTTYTSTPSQTPETPVFDDPTATPEDIRTPSATPVPTATSTPPNTTEPGGCLVRSLVNTNARTLPVISPQTVIGVLPANSYIRIDAYYIEETDDADYIWYRYWFDLENAEAWSRADLFSERADIPACRLLPKVVEP